MILRWLAAFALLVLLWSLFRLAMGMRWAKVSRQRAREAEEAGGRRVIAEIPLSDAELIFFTEDREAFRWSGRQALKAEVVGARLLLNGGIIGSAQRPRATLAAPPPPEEFEGRERWDVVLYLGGDRREVVPCGTLREGVSREIADRVFRAIRATVEA